MNRLSYQCNFKASLRAGLRATETQQLARNARNLIAAKVQLRLGHPWEELAGRCSIEKKSDSGKWRVKHAPLAR